MNGFTDTDKRKLVFKRKNKYNPTKEFEYKENHYEVYSDIVDWQTAKRICELKGGHLLVVDSKAENDYVFNQINALTNEHYWMGLSDAASEGNWQWLVPTTSAYANWNTNEPNNDGGLENYGEMIASSGKWNDMAGYYCIHQNVGFICEYEASSPQLISLVSDTNLDGTISISDVTAIQRHLAELARLTKGQLALADTNGDGKVDISDATYLQKYLAEFDGIVLGNHEPDYEQEEHKTREEILQEIFGEIDYDDDDDEDEGFTMSM